MDLDVSEDERLPSGELVREASGTSLAVWTESPSLSLLRLATLWEEEEGSPQWLSKGTHGWGSFCLGGGNPHDTCCQTRIGQLPTMSL